MQSTANRAKCLYCGEEVQNVSKGEHIIPKALGGTCTISQFCRERTVCNPCNNGVLSDLDKELSSQSPLSMVAAQELNRFLGETWDVDPSVKNLLLEARADFSNTSMTVFPQMIFEPEPNGPLIRGDAEEMQQFGINAFQGVFLKFLLEAIQAYIAGDKKRFHLNRADLPKSFQDIYYYPPRVFARKPIKDFESGMSFHLSYLYKESKEFALAQMKQLGSLKSFQRFESGLGSERPPFRCRIQPNKIRRAILKLGINLLAAFCPNTLVNRESFASAIGGVLGELPLPHADLKNTGFVHATDLESIRSGDSVHSFRLLHMDGKWHIYSSFFGGRIGTTVCFPGPNSENWRCADVIAPLRPKEGTQLKKWTVSTSNLLKPLSVKVEWKDWSKIIPTIPICNLQMELREIEVG